ncbi:collagen-binding protein [Bacteroidia bacterium]|nr:collagen-binding protein [Bacteroidia bacterium]
MNLILKQGVLIAIFMAINSFIAFSQDLSKRIELSADDSAKVTMAYESQDVVVVGAKNKYSRKNNPAVDLMKKVIEHKNRNRIENRNEYSVQIYDKLTLALDEFDPKDTSNLFFRFFPFLRNHTETSELNGNQVLNISLREKISGLYYRRSPHLNKIIVSAQRHTGVDESFDSDGAITHNLEEIFKGINVFDNDITILLNKFVSPLSSIFAIAYYEYEIEDTVYVDGKPAVVLAFAPANRQSFGFTGRLQVALDGTFALQKISMTTSRNINLNWVDKMRIVQQFKELDDGTRVMERENIYAVFRPTTTSRPPLYAHLFRNFDQYNFSPGNLDSMAHLLGNIRVLPDASAKSGAFWIENRPYPLSEQENQLEIVLLLLRDDPVYTGLIKFFEMLISGYIPTRFDKNESRFDFGPVTSTFSSNYLEGFRLRIGGITTARLHPQWFLGGYAAYGFKDKKWKYQARLTHSLEPRKQHAMERPIHNISLTHRFDVFIPGSYSPFMENDNFFNSLKTGIAETQMQYIRSTEIRYEKEWRNGFSINTWLRNENNCAAGTLTPFPEFMTTVAGLQLRYAPDEKFYSGRGGRKSAFNVAREVPVFTLSHQMGLESVLGSDFSYHYSEASAEKRIWLSSFGYIDAVVRAGRVWNKAPFPLLIFPLTNQSLFIRSESFMMMRSMEFVSDEYASLFATYYLKGWIFNRIPLFNRLKWREVVSLGAVYGRLSDKNNPAVEPFGLFEFPAGTRPFGKQPYVEASIGIDNIFKVMRVDYFRRLTYLDDPNIRKGGIRLAFRFSF